MHESFIELHDRYQKYQTFIVVPQLYTIQISNIYFFSPSLMGIIKKDIALMDATVKILWLLTSCLGQSCGCLNTPTSWFRYCGNYHSWFYPLLNKVSVTPYFSITSLPDTVSLPVYCQNKKKSIIKRLR